MKNHTSVLRMSNRHTSLAFILLAPHSSDRHIKILDADASLHFALMRLHLVELIRRSMSDPTNDVSAALDFATEYLAPRAPTNDAFLRDFEQAMLLLIIDPKALTPELAAILDPALRKDIAARVNDAILLSQGENTRSRLLELVKTRAWAERVARELKKDVPAELDIGLDPDMAAGAAASGAGGQAARLRSAGHGHIDGDAMAT